MTRYRSGSSFWPERSPASKRALFLKRSIHIAIGFAVFVIASHSIADMLAFPAADAAGGDRPTMAGGICWRDWPYVQSGCPAGQVASAAAAAATRAVRVIPGIAGRHLRQARRRRRAPNLRRHRALRRLTGPDKVSKRSPCRSRRQHLRHRLHR